MHRNSKVDLGLEEMEANHGPNCPNFRVENPCRTSQCRNGRRKTRRHSQQTLRRIGRAVPAETIDLPGRNLRGDQGVTSYRKALLISSPYRFKTTVPSTTKSRRKRPPIIDAIRMTVTRSLLRMVFQTRNHLSISECMHPVWSRLHTFIANFLVP